MPYAMHRKVRVEDSMHVCYSKSDGSSMQHERCSLQGAAHTQTSPKREILKGGKENLNDSSEGDRTIASCCCS